MDKEPGPTDEEGLPRPWGRVPGPALRLAVGLGDSLREGELVRGLIDGGEFVLAARCLSGDQLQECITRGQADLALASPDLHRLSSAALEELAHSRFPLVLLVPGPHDSRWDALPGILLPWDADVTAV